MPTKTENSPVTKLFRPLAHAAWSPVSLFVLTIVIAALYITMEWVFIFTRPSFLQTIPLLQKIQAFTTASSLLVLACCLVLSLILVSGWIIKNAAYRKVLTSLAMLLPAFLIAALVLLMVDNFTYTVFQFGIISTSGWSRALYGILFSLLVIYLYFKLMEFLNLLAVLFARQKPFHRLILISVLLVLAVAGAIIPAESILDSSLDVSQHRPMRNNASLPDILLITVDGVNAEYTSLDNNERDTTPFLRSIATESLRAINPFTNAQGTIGSVTAILTGRYPADTRVINSSDILRGEDAYQSLPAILSDYGYYTAQFSNPVYADAYKINFQNAFDEANGRSAEFDPLMFTLSKLYPGVDHLFQQEVIDRLGARLGHIYFISDMTNPYEQVTEAPLKFNDSQKLARLFTLLEDSRQPVFAHLHWMGTHGPNYFPEEQVFSSGLNLDHQDTKNQLFYYDALLEFDRAVEEIYAYLEENKLLDNTILVVTSDHSQKWTNSRLPLLMRFPQGDYSDVITHNVQSIDIAPTLLDYLDIAVPGWMAGQSLISPHYEPHAIITAKIPKFKKDPATGKGVYPESKAPFYQFGRMSVIMCDQWFEIDVQTLSTSQGKVKEYHTPCSDLLTEEQALVLIMQHMQRYGFDTSSLAPLLNAPGSESH